MFHPQLEVCRMAAKRSGEPAVANGYDESGGDGPAKDGGTGENSVPGIGAPTLDGCDTGDFWEKKYKEAYDYVMKNIVTGKPPGLDMDVSPYYQVSTEMLANYVTLDWHHRQHIKCKIETIAEYT